ncbi:MAG: Rieske 2Fe-2S domain-containing protein [Microbacteriaceae bacterium]
MHETHDDRTWLDTGVSPAELGGDPLRLDWEPPRALAIVGPDIVCFEDTCPHEDFSLSEGFLEGGIIECSFHFARFCLRSGAVLTQPARRGLLVYDVQVRQGRIFVSESPLDRPTD